jgi:hypothetical protein
LLTELLALLEQDYSVLVKAVSLTNESVGGSRRLFDDAFEILI